MIGFSSRLDEHVLFKSGSIGKKSEGVPNRVDHRYLVCQHALRQRTIERHIEHRPQNRYQPTVDIDDTVELQHSQEDNRETIGRYSKGKKFKSRWF